MRKLAMFAVLALIACACGGHATSTEGTQATGDGASTPAPLAVPGQLSWPPDDTRAASALSFSGFNTNGISPGSSKDGLTVHVRAGEDPFGWAQYKLGGFSAGTAPAVLELDGYVLDDECWLAAADWERGTWRWLRKWSYGEAARFVLPAGGGLISSSGNLHFAFAVEAGHQLDLTSGSVDTVDTTSLPFPRLGMWFGDWERNTIDELSRYDVLIDHFGGKHLYWDSGEPMYGDAIRQRNPDCTLLTYTAFSEISYYADWDGAYNHWMRDWPDEWFLTEAGTELAVGIDAVQTEITVADWTQTGEAHGEMPTVWDIFHVDGDVLCGGEIMTVTALDEAAKTLTVERNRYEKLPPEGRAHSAGARIAPIIRFWPGTFMVNLTSQCPSAQLHGASGPEQWGDYYFRMSLAGERWFDDYTYAQDGFLFDRMEDAESWIFWNTANSVDLDQDNVAESFADFDAAWLAGIQHITGLFNAQFPGAPILRNLGGGRRFGDYNGNHFETWPRYSWDGWPGRATGWHWEFFGIAEDYPIEWEDMFGGVNEWAAHSSQPNLTWVETYEDEDGADSNGDGSYDNPMDDPGFVPGYRKMRWGLASALLAGSYFSYEINTNGHGSLGLMWFDEYDGVGHARGWLGWPAGDIIKLKDVPEAEATNPADPVHEDVIEYGVWAREYTGGLAIVNPCYSAQEVELPPGRWQRLAGTQAPAVNSGALEEGSLTMPPYDGLVLKRVP